MSPTDLAESDPLVSALRDPAEHAGHRGVHPPRHYRPGVGRHRRKSGGPGRRRLRTLHRWTGLVAGAVLIFLAITGLVINHAHQLGLDRQTAGLGWLSAWYDLPIVTPLGAELPGGPVVWSGAFIHLSNQRHRMDGLLGAIPLADLTLAAGPHDLLLLTRQGELVERLPLERFSLPLAGLGLDPAGNPAVRDGTGTWRAGPDLLDWSAADGNGVAWATVSPVPAGRLAELGISAIQPELTWERVLLDLHAGRLFGVTGPFLVDLAAIAVLYLFISGLVTWRRRGP